MGSLKKKKGRRCRKKLVEKKKVFKPKQVWPATTSTHKMLACNESTLLIKNAD